MSYSSLPNTSDNLKLPTGATEMERLSRVQDFMHLHFSEALGVMQQQSDDTEKKVVQVTGGLSNQLYRVYCDDLKSRFSAKCPALEDKLFRTSRNGSCVSTRYVLVRVFGEKAEGAADGNETLFDRGFENSLCFDLFYSQENEGANFGPALLATFGNGRVEAFFENARMRTVADMGNKHLNTNLARQLAQLHALDFRSLMKGKADEKLYWKTLRDMVAGCKEEIEEDTAFYSAGEEKHQPQRLTPKQLKFIERFFDKDTMGSFLEKHLEMLYTKASPFLAENVFSHCDLHDANVLLMEDDKRIELIDFEYVAICPRGFDIAMLLFSAISIMTGDIFTEQKVVKGSFYEKSDAELCDFFSKIMADKTQDVSADPYGVPPQVIEDFLIAYVDETRSISTDSTGTDFLSSLKITQLAEDLERTFVPLVRILWAAYSVMQCRVVEDGTGEICAEDYDYLLHGFLEWHLGYETCKGRILH